MKPTIELVNDLARSNAEYYGAKGDTLTEIIRQVGIDLVEHANEIMKELDAEKYQYDWGKARAERDCGSMMIQISSLFGEHPDKTK